MSRCARCSDDVILGPPARAWCGGVVGHLDRHRRTLIVRHYDTTGVEVDGGTDGGTDGGREGASQCLEGTDGWRALWPPVT